MQEPDSVAFCPDCGNKLDPEVKFCGKCGLSRLQMQDPVEAVATADSYSSVSYGEKFVKFDSKGDELLKKNSTVLKSHKPLMWILAVVASFVAIGFAGRTNTNQGSSLVSNSANLVPTVSPSAVPPRSSSPIARPTAASKSPKPVQNSVSKVAHEPAVAALRPKKVDQCAIDSQTISDLVAYKNVIAGIPTGRNDSSNTSRILDWAQSASNLSNAVLSDSSNASGRIVSVMGDASTDLSDLAGLATDWANNNLSDPVNFPAQYSAAALKVRTDYTRMDAICGTKLPGL